MKRYPWRRLAPFLFLVACAASCTGVDAQRLAAERATHDWCAPMLRRYLEADQALDEAARATHLRTLDAWTARLVAQEALAGGR